MNSKSDSRYRKREQKAPGEFVRVLMPFVLIVGRCSLAKNLRCAPPPEPRFVLQQVVDAITRHNEIDVANQKYNPQDWVIEPEEVKEESIAIKRQHNLIPKIENKTAPNTTHRADVIFLNITLLSRHRDPRSSTQVRVKNFDL